MKRILVTALVLACILHPSRATEQIKYQPGGGMLIMFWNLENFFDWRTDSLRQNASDAEFSSYGRRHWTKKRFLAKCRAVAKTVFWIGDLKGRLPDVIGFAETENRFVLERLVKETALRKAGYGIVHYDSPDPRGIDVSLLFLRSSLELLDSRPLRISKVRTRDILLAKFRTARGDSIAFLVNHHPSKYGEDSGWKRKEALRRLRGAVDSLMAAGIKDIVAMGDFNDTPENQAFDIVASGGEEGDSPLVNLALKLAGEGKGTIRYSGRWDMIDMFLVSKSLAGRRPPPAMETVTVPFLVAKDRAHGGEKPLRTYSGPKYLGGVSDHLPILLVIQ